jgi:glutathione synthase/RimK-type ligase-like ATP-grasp enzyme
VSPTGSDRDSCSIAIVTLSDDLHALVVQKTLRSIPGVTCDIIEADRLAGQPTGLTWRAPADGTGFRVPIRDGGCLEIAAVDLIWFRRWNRPQQATQGVADVAQSEVINHSCSATLLGGLLTAFTGVWVSHPDATRRAENKLNQLRAAEAADFAVPKTMISQNPSEIRAFCAALPGPAVIKSVHGTPHSQLFTVTVAAEHLAEDDALSICPTIFQEYVPGSRHLRVLCCGRRTYAAEIETDQLDWRLDLDVPITPVELDALTEARLADVLDRLGLRMGVADLKVTPTGDVVWLELNPQGQFLFLEGLTGMDLTKPFCDFLLDEVRRAHTPANGVKDTKA